MSFLGKNAFGLQSDGAADGAPAPGNSSTSPPSPPMVPGASSVAALFAQKNNYTDRQVETG